MQGTHRSTAAAQGLRLQRNVSRAIVRAELQTGSGSSYRPTSDGCDPIAAAAAVHAYEGTQANARGADGDGNTAGIPPVPRPLLLALARQAFAGSLLTAAALSSAHATTLDLGPAEIVESGAEPAAAGGADSALGSSAQALEDGIARSLQFAQIRQSGDGNLARIDQPGIGNQASIVQTGNGGSASIMQSGRGNVASITQGSR